VVAGYYLEKRRRRGTEVAGRECLVGRIEVSDDFFTLPTNGVDEWSRRIIANGYE